LLSVHTTAGASTTVNTMKMLLSCSHVEVRLNGGRDPRGGQLQMFYNGVWAKVCDRFNYAVALVVCNMLGFGYIGRPSATTTNYQYGYNFDQIWLDSVWCKGTEENIAECDRSGWFRSYCLDDHKHAVSCLPGNALALVGGESPREGRLKCFTMAPGKPCVILDSTTQQHELFAILSDSDTLDRKWILACTAPGKE